MEQDTQAHFKMDWCVAFGRLLVEARAIDTDNMIGDALLYGSAAGIYYTILRRVKAPDDAWDMSEILTPRAPNNG